MDPCPCFQPMITRGTAENPMQPEEVLALADSQEWTGITVCETPDVVAGRGLYATAPFKRNAIICDYYGYDDIPKIVVHVDLSELPNPVDDFELVYFDHVRKVKVLVRPDGFFLYAKYANHSHRHPNATLSKVVVDLDPPPLGCGKRVAVPVLRALRDIQPGEEICWCYNRRAGIPVPNWYGMCRSNHAKCVAKRNGLVLQPPSVSAVCIGCIVGFGLLWLSKILCFSKIVVQSPFIEKLFFVYVEVLI